MLTRGISIALAGAWLLAGCYRQPPPPAAPPPRTAPAIEDTGWPAALEFRMVEKSDVIKHNGLAMFSVESRLPAFHSDPPGVAQTLNARMGRLARPDVDPRTHEGSYNIDCTVELANRYAVILDCSQHLDERTHEEADEGAGGSSEPKHLTFGWWLRRGLPELSIEQLAPQFDLRAAIDAAVPSQPAGCDLRACSFDPRSFLVDADGVMLIATETCAAECGDALPAIPLDQLAPTHAWGSELVTRVRRRLDAGEPLVEGDRSN